MSAIQKLAAFDAGLGKVGSASRWLEKALDRASELELTATQVDLLRFVAVLDFRRSLPRAARGTLRKARNAAPHDARTIAVTTADEAALMLATGETAGVAEQLEGAVNALMDLGEQDEARSALANLVRAYSLSRRPAEASAVLARAEESGLLHSREIAELREVVADAYLIARPYDERSASRLYRSAIESVAVSLGPFSKASMWLRAATKLADAFHHREAVTFYRRGLRLYDKAGDSEMTYRVTNDLGLALYYSGDVIKGDTEMQRAVTLADSLQTASLRAEARLNRAEVVRRGRRDPAEAARLAKEALDIAVAHNDEAHVASAYASLAMSYKDQKNWNKAIEAAAKAASLAQRIHNWTALTVSLDVLGEIASIQDRPAQAVALHRREITSALRADDYEHLAEAIGHLLAAQYKASSDISWEEFGQQLIEAAQRSRREAEASAWLLSLSENLLHENRADDARQAFVLAFVLALVSAEEGKQVWIRSIAQAAYVLAGASKAFLSANEIAQFIDAVTTAVAQAQPAYGDLVHDVVTEFLAEVTVAD